MQTIVKNRRFAFHHQNEALLFQFLLHECISAHGILRNKPCPALMRHVIGHSDNEENIWQAPFGHVIRLRQYCTLFTTHFGDPSSTLSQQLGQTIERAYSAALLCRSYHDKDENQLALLYQPLKRELSSFLKLLFEKLSDYRDSPSVLYFLLRHHEQCDAAYRQPIVKKMFCSFFPQGIEQAQAYLTERFSQKGFDHLIPSIEENLKKIDSAFPLESACKEASLD